MKTTVTIEKEVDIKLVSVVLAVRYEEEDIPKDFPMREGNIWSALIEVETGKILRWPAGQSGELYMKVCDQGSYSLLDEEGRSVRALIDEYVPNNLIPGEYGDYVHFIINESGIITNWPKNPSFEDFNL